VHDLEQIQLLAARFPEQIAFHVARLDGQVIAGTVSFRTATVVHLQYIAASEVGHAVSALDGLMEILIAQARHAGARYFDFGTSNEDQGRVLNEGLYRFKCEFGAGGVAYETYELDLAAAA
jgi:lipid II:glycine glycyltransferase (peptidoglycan interpeptide bridge formation enzyme)